MGAEITDTFCITYYLLVIGWPNMIIKITNIHKAHKQLQIVVFADFISKFCFLYYVTWLGMLLMASWHSSPHYSFLVHDYDTVIHFPISKLTFIVKKNTPISFNEVVLSWHVRGGANIIISISFSLFPSAVLPSFGILTD